MLSKHTFIRRMIRLVIRTNTGAQLRFKGGASQVEPKYGESGLRCLPVSDTCCLSEERSRRFFHCKYLRSLIGALSIYSEAESGEYLNFVPFFLEKIFVFLYISCHSSGLPRLPGRSIELSAKFRFFATH